MTPRAIVTDIEGTTSSIAFVHQVLFPWARERLADFVATHGQEVAPVLAAVRAEAGELDDAGCVAQLLAWHDADVKIAPLKTLQGMIWARGYADGALHGHVYPDAAAALRRWHAAGIQLFVYSSGSVAAQRLLFRHSVEGDLTPLFGGWFDTTIGGKREAASYAAIAGKIGEAPEDILFLSDLAPELVAARAAGLAVTQLVRDGEAQRADWPVAHSFDDILEVQP